MIVRRTAALYEALAIDPHDYSDLSDDYSNDDNAYRFVRSNVPATRKADRNGR